MTDEIRRRELAAIHTCKKSLGMDEDTYRKMIATVTNDPALRSAGLLSRDQRRDVLNHMRMLGAQQKNRGVHYRGRPHNLDQQPMLQKVEALLADMNLSWNYADAIAKRQTGIAKVAWVRKTEHLQGIIAALSVEQKKRQLLKEVNRRLTELGKTHADAEREHTLPANWWRSLAALEYLLDRIKSDQPVEG